MKNVHRMHTGINRISWRINLFMSLSVFNDYSFAGCIFGWIKARVGQSF